MSGRGTSWTSSRTVIWNSRGRFRHCRITIACMSHIDNAMARITAERLIQHLERAGFVLGCVTEFREADVYDGCGEVDKAEPTPSGLVPAESDPAEVFEA